MTVLVFVTRTVGRWAASLALAIDASSLASFFFAALRSLASCVALSVSVVICAWAASSAAVSSRRLRVQGLELETKVDRPCLLDSQAVLQRGHRDRRHGQGRRRGGPGGGRPDGSVPEQERGDDAEHGDESSDAWRMDGHGAATSDRDVSNVGLRLRLAQ